MRAPDRPIARINSRGDGIDAAAGRVTWYVTYEGPQSVFVDDEGRLFSMPQGCGLVARWIETRRDWWVGNFIVLHGQSIRRNVLADLRERLRELRAVIA